jgi:hypothetical protein
MWWEGWAIYAFTNAGTERRALRAAMRMRPMRSICATCSALEASLIRVFHFGCLRIVVSGVLRVPSNNTRTIPEVNSLSTFCYSAPMRLPPILAVLAPVLGALALAVPSPWSWTAAALAVLAAAGAGLATRVPGFLVGRPLVSAPLAGALATLSGYLLQQSLSEPAGWIQAAFLAGAVVCAGVAGVPLPSPRAARALPPLLLLLAALPAQAQTVLPCSSACPERYYFETQPCTAGTCARSYAPLPTEFSGGKGMSLAAYEGVQVTVCASNGHTLSGAGLLKWWVWEPWVPNSSSSTPSFDLDLADADRGEECSYSTLADGGVVSGVGAGDGGSNLTYRCRCLRFSDWKVGGLSSRRVILEGEGVTASGGDQIEVRIVGLQVLR